MKSTITLALLLASTLSTAAFAEGIPGTQQNPPPRESDMGAKHGMKHACDDEMDDCVAEGLNLTEDQRQKIRGILDSSRQKRDALRNDTHQQIKQVLTPEQQKKLDARRDDILRYRADRLRERAKHLDERAKEMNREQKKERKNQ
jgi:Spy/CpxP family protein refolding chaperone